MRRHASGPGWCTGPRAPRRSSNGHQVEPGLARPRRGRARCRVAPPTGQVHSPSTCDQPDARRTPASAGSSRSPRRSPPASGPGPAQHRLGRRRAARRRTAPACAPGRDHPGGGEPAVADDVDRPAAVVLAAGGDELGAAGSAPRSRWVRAAARTNAASRSRWTPASSKRSSSARRGHPPGDQLDHRRRAGCSEVVAQLSHDRGVGRRRRRCRRRARGSGPSRRARTALSDGRRAAAGRCTGGSGRSRAGRPGTSRRRACERERAEVVGAVVERPAAPATAAARARG